MRAFDRFDQHQAAALVMPCLGIQRWAIHLAADRPYHDLDHLITRAEDLARTLTPVEIDLARRHRHTRVLHRHDGIHRLQADRVQRRMTSLTTPQTEFLPPALSAYQDRFAYPFLIRLAGRSTARICQLLQQRLHHTPSQETATLRTELTQIALLALVRRII